MELSFPFPLKSSPALALARFSMGAWSKDHEFLTAVPKLGALHVEGSQRPQGVVFAPWRLDK